MAIGALGGVNGMGAMAYAAARLRAQDEARAARLAADPRVYLPDEDEGGPVPCVICEAPTPPRSLVCPECRAQGWTAATCECGAHLTRNDQKAKGGVRARCARCREELAPSGEALSMQAQRRGTR